MAPATPKSTNKSKSQSVADTDSNLDYLLLLMATSSADFKPDYHAVAKEVGISSANTAQKRYKKIVEQSGIYKLDKGRVVRVATASTSTADTQGKKETKGETDTDLVEDIPK